MTPRRLRTTAAVTGVVLGVALASLAGCASPDSNPGGAGGSTSTGSGSSGPAPTSPAPSPTASSTRPAVGQTVTLDGTIVEGAEPSCVILKTTSGLYELLSATARPQQGQHVVVTGHVVRVMSHCMQGSPFVVETLTPQ